MVFKIQVSNKKAKVAKVGEVIRFWYWNATQCWSKAKDLSLHFTSTPLIFAIMLVQRNKPFTWSSLSLSMVYFCLFFCGPKVDNLALNNLPHITKVQRCPFCPSFLVGCIYVITMSKTISQNTPYKIIAMLLCSWIIASDFSTRIKLKTHS